jgi:hypothetical protein
VQHHLAEHMEEALLFALPTPVVNENDQESLASSRTAKSAEISNGSSEEESDGEATGSVKSQTDLPAGQAQDASLFGQLLLQKGLGGDYEARMALLEPHVAGAGESSSRDKKT